MGRREKLNKIRARLEKDGMESHRSKQVARLELLKEFMEKEKAEPIKVSKPRKPRKSRAKKAVK